MQEKGAQKVEVQKCARDRWVKINCWVSESYHSRMLEF